MKHILWLLLFLSFGTANAEEIQIGQGTACDTQAQMETFTRAQDELGSVDAAIQKVNTSEKSTACGYVILAYFKGEEVTHIFTKRGKTHIHRAMVVAFYVNGAWLHVTPSVQFVSFLEPMGDA